MLKTSVLIASSSLAALLFSGALAQEAKKDEHQRSPTPAARSDNNPPNQAREQSGNRSERTQSNSKDGQAGPERATREGQKEPKRDSVNNKASKTEKEGRGTNNERSVTKTEKKDTSETSRKSGTDKSTNRDTQNKEQRVQSNRNASTPSKNSTESKQGSARDHENRKGDEAAKAPDANGPGRVQHTELSVDKRTQVHQTIMREQRINRVTRAVFIPSVGKRLPRSVHVERLPIAIVSLVPEYRDYDYVVVDDELCVIDPSSYEVVLVIGPSNGPPRDQVSAGLNLSDGDIAFLFNEISVSTRSTLGLGALNEGETVMPNMEVLRFSESILDRVPQLRSYRYFTAERRIVIVNPENMRIVFVSPPTR